MAFPRSRISARQVSQICRHTSGSTEQTKERAVPSLAPAHPQVYTKSTNMNMNKTGGLIMPYLPANQAQCLLARADEVFCQLVQVYGPFSHQLSDPSPSSAKLTDLLPNSPATPAVLFTDTHTHKRAPLAADPSLPSLSPGTMGPFILWCQHACVSTLNAHPSHQLVCCEAHC